MKRLEKPKYQVEAKLTELDSEVQINLSKLNDPEKPYQL